MDASSYYLMFGVGTIAFVSIGVLMYLLITKIEKIRSLESSIKILKKSFDELDEQARLIVRTDLELNKAQEESDKRLRGLDTLQRTSRVISTTLDEAEIFNRLNRSLMIDSNFEKNIIFILNSDESFIEKIVVGYSENDAKFIVSNLEKDNSLLSLLKEGRTLSSLNTTLKIRESIISLFGTEHFIIAPILSQNGIIGVSFVGNLSNASNITEGDEEFIVILANQIGQALENARLFEQVYRSSQILENKVQNRTKQLADALEKVQTISKAKSDFISAVSHELRTPLTSIKGYASILMAGKLGEVPEQVRQRLGKINTHSDNLVKLINNLLDISRIESGRVKMNISKCTLPIIAENVHDLLTPQMKEKNIQWITNISDNIPELYLDKGQIERVFINLVSNAIKFTPEMGSITINAIKDNNGIVNVSVEDTGIGISKEDIEKLFDEFYRVDNRINQNVKGTGLGLALVKKIVEAHKGRIWITSEVGKGTAFNFTLPIKNEKE